jgi:hypothetical protein
VGPGFRSFASYRLRLLLHCGVTWQTHPTASCEGAPHIWWHKARNPRGGHYHHGNALPQTTARQAWSLGQ